MARHPLRTIKRSAGKTSVSRKKIRQAVLDSGQVLIVRKETSVEGSPPGSGKKAKTLHGEITAFKFPTDGSVVRVTPKKLKQLIETSVIVSGARPVEE